MEATYPGATALDQQPPTEAGGERRKAYFCLPDHLENRMCQARNICNLIAEVAGDVPKDKNITIRADALSSLMDVLCDLLPEEGSLDYMVVTSEESP